MASSAGEGGQWIFGKDKGLAIRNVCKEFILLCRKLDLLTDATMAIDGSKFKAVNNRDKNFTQAKLQRLVMTSARAEQPQVCLIDIGLPELDGN